MRASRQEPQEQQHGDGNSTGCRRKTSCRSGDTSTLEVGIGAEEPDHRAPHRLMNVELSL